MYSVIFFISGLLGRNLVLLRYLNPLVKIFSNNSNTSHIVVSFTNDVVSKVTYCVAQTFQNALNKQCKYQFTQSKG